MFSNRFAFAALGAACIAAAATGGYVASRQNATPAAPPAVTAANATAPAPAGAPNRPVQETEAVGGSAPAAATRAAAPKTAAATKGAPPAAAARRADPPASSVARATSSGAPRQEASPTLDRSWPSSAGPAPASTASASPTPAPAAAAESGAGASRADDRVAQEIPRAPEPPQKTFEELVISTDSVIGLQTETSITSDRARVEDRVEARVTRDVKVGDRVAIPAGARAIGSVTQVDRGGKFRERARLGLRFHTLVLADGTRLQITTETIYRDGVAPGNESAAKIGGGAVGGAILGAILGGAKGAMIGATTGAGAGTAAVAAGERNAATLPAGTPMTVRIISPVTVTIEQ